MRGIGFSAIMYGMKKIAILYSIAVLVAVGAYFAYRAFATVAPIDLTGWAWSSKNIGWISLNCANPPSTCSTHPYKVTLDPNTALFSGYAWSSNIGWIKFGPDVVNSTDDMSPNYPPKLPRIPATLVSVTVDNEPRYQVQGWIRVCSVFASGCSGPLDGNAAWDGWIKMSGDTITCDTAKFETCLSADGSGLEGWAWGSNNISWIKFTTTGVAKNALSEPIGVSGVMIKEVRPR